MDIMAEAIEMAEFVVVFVSRAYRDSYNCKLEGKHAQIRERKGLAKIIYVMMEEDYTPQSVCPWKSCIDLCRRLGLAKIICFIKDEDYTSQTVRS